MNKRIKLNERWSLIHNQYDYQLLEHLPERVLDQDTPTAKKGDIMPPKDKFHQSYHPTVEKAIDKIMQIELNQEPSCDWTGYLSQLTKLYQKYRG